MIYAKVWRTDRSLNYCRMHRQIWRLVMKQFIHHIEIRYLCRTYYPWPTDKQCENFTTVFSKGQMLPAVALASNPNSGNTWLRYLIEGITGIFTGSFYGDIDISRKGNSAFDGNQRRNLISWIISLRNLSMAKIFCRLLWRKNLQNRIYCISYSNSKLFSPNIKLIILTIFN